MGVDAGSGDHTDAGFAGEVESDFLSGRNFDRLVGFTDAAVAIAITVLVLPLVGLTDLAPGQSVWGLIGEHSNQVVAFVMTFCVMAMLWGVHNRILNGARGYDQLVFWLNIGWLGLMVLLPWPAALVGEVDLDADGSSGVFVFYWTTMAAISLMTTAMAWHLERHPEMLHRAARGRRSRRDHWRGPIFAGYCLLIGLVSLVAPGVAVYMPFGLFVLGAATGSRGPSTPVADARSPQS